jgi:hypothetical protein
MEATWATPSDPVFKLVPDAFDRQVSAFYAELGSPEVSLDSFWMIYVSLLNAFNTDIEDGLRDDFEHADDHFEQTAALIPAQVNLPVLGDLGYQYLGGLAHPPSAASDEDEDDNSDKEKDDGREYAVFTDDKPDD